VPTVPSRLFSIERLGQHIDGARLVALHDRACTRFGGSIMRSVPAASIKMLVVLFSVGVATHAAAQNIVLNPDFNAPVTLVPWTQFLSASPDPTGVGAAPAAAASPDAGNSPTSGSALTDINATTPAVNAASGISQCIDFGTTTVSLLNYGASIFVPAATTTDGAINATVEVRLFANAGCNGFITGGSQCRTFIAGLSTNTWYAIGDSGFTPPGGSVSAASAQVRAYLRQTGGPTQTDYKANFDNFHLVLNSATPVRLQQFDVE